MEIRTKILVLLAEEAFLSKKGIESGKASYLIDFLMEIIGSLLRLKPQVLSRSLMGTDFA